MIGILPTLREEHLTHASISANPRYALLDEQMLLARGEDLHLDIRGRRGRSTTYADSIAPEAACTSMQLHLQVSPDEFAAYWNAAQCLASVQVARRCQLAVPPRPRALARDAGSRCSRRPPTPAPAELKAQGVRPRVWFGERWITSVFDLFEENIRYFPALLPVIDDEDPLAGARARAARPRCTSCGCTTAPSTAGTARSTTSSTARRTCASRTACCPPGRPSSTSLANAAFYYGAGAHAGRAGPAAVVADVVLAPPRRTSPRRAPTGIDAQVYWPGRARSRDRARAAPAAADGARGSGALGRRRRGPRPAARHHRGSAARPGRNGATWQVGRCATSRRRARTGARRCGAMTQATSSACTPTSPSTPGQCPDFCVQGVRLSGCSLGNVWTQRCPSTSSRSSALSAVSTSSRTP